MPVKTVTGKTTIKTQREHGQSEFLLGAFHMAMPWLAWAGVTFFGAALRLGLYLGARGALVWTGLGMLGVALVIAWFDARLRSHRASWEGRWIGPVTAVGAGLFTCLWLALGFSVPLALAWLFAGIIGSVCWDGWMAHGDNKDLAATFNKGAGAAGVEGARMFEVSRRRAGAGVEEDEYDDPAVPRPRAPRTRRPAGGRAGHSEVIEAGLVLPSDPAMTADEVGDRMGHAEVVTRSRPGSFALISGPDDAGLSRVRITDPDLLTAGPIGWPGPSAPGADMREPFRIALLQTGVPFLYRRLPVHHGRVSGKTGSAKTMGLCWNMLAEGITREGYSAWAADVVKGEQFLGALRPALHGLALDPEAVMLLLKRLHRARLDRCNFLGRNHHTEWFPGCGLVFMECWLEEAAGILKLLGTSRSDIGAGAFPLADWVEDINSARSAGMAWWCSYQKPDKTQAASTVARSQMGHVCFALADKDDVQFGLSDLQRERGCRPTLWDRPQCKAMAYFDTETVPEEEKVTPMRFFNWGPGSARIAAYAAEWQARDRPLDEVTGEAMSWEPAVSPTSAVLPSAVTRPYDKAAPAARSMSSKRASKLLAMNKLRALICDWRDKDREQFTLRQLEPYYADIGKDRTWFYTALAELCSERLLEELEGETPRTWQILPAVRAVPDPQEDEQDSDGEEAG